MAGPLVMIYIFFLFFSAVLLCPYYVSDIFNPYLHSDDVYSWKSYESGLQIVNQDAGSSLAMNCLHDLEMAGNFEDLTFFSEYCFGYCS